MEPATKTGPPLLVTTEATASKAPPSMVTSELVKSAFTTSAESEAAPERPRYHYATDDGSSERSLHRLTCAGSNTSDSTMASSLIRSLGTRGNNDESNHLREKSRMRASYDRRSNGFSNPTGQLDLESRWRPQNAPP